MISIKTYSICLISLLFLGCGKSPLQAAIDPFTGNCDLYEKLVDKGGLNYSQDFYGINITGISGAQCYTDGKGWKNFQLWTDATPEKMRKALSQACRVSEDKFVRKNASIGEAIIDEGEKTLTCYYEQGSGQNGNTILIMRSMK
jgi:hypothetical protein